MKILKFLILIIFFAGAEIAAQETGSLSTDNEATIYSRKELKSEYRKLKAKGICLISTSSIVGLAGPLFLSFMGGVYEQPLFYLGALGTAGVGGVGIWGGSQYIKKGNDIKDSMTLSIAPVLNPWEKQLGVQLSIAF